MLLYIVIILLYDIILLKITKKENMKEQIIKILEAQEDGSFFKTALLVYREIKSGSFKKAVSNLKNHSFKSNMEFSTISTALVFMTCMVAYVSFMFASNFTDAIVFKILVCSIPFLTMASASTFLICFSIIQNEKKFNKNVGE